MKGVSEVSAPPPWAPNVLVRRCLQYMDLGGTSLPLDAHILASIAAVQEDLASRGQRVLLLAKRVMHTCFLAFLKL